MSSATSPMNRWKAWDNFLETTPDTGFMQSSSWADFRLTAGFEHFGAILKDQNGILGGAIVQRYACCSKNCFYYIQDGPVLPTDNMLAAEVFEAILAEIDSRRTSEQQTVSHLRIEPRWQRMPDFASGFEAQSSDADFIEPRRTLWIDLRCSEEAILAQMKPKGRYNIRVAQKHGVSVTEDTSEQGLEDFQSIYEDMAARQGIDAKPPDYFETLLSILSCEKRGSIFFAELQGKRLAAAVVVYFGRRATYFFGGSLDLCRNVMAPYLLHFEIMRRAKALGYEWYDLWGVAPENEPEDPWQDISVFKRKFGGQEIEFVPTLDYVYDHAAYEHYRKRENSCEDGDAL
jgi:peptidoglycan pentaglycine glycine transferase (the first glycine)